MPLTALPALADVLARASLPYDFTWHDYAPLCPRLSMVDWGGIYCASPSTAYCQVCMDKAGSRFGPVNIAAWRETYARFVRRARRNLVPDPDVGGRLRRYLPELQTHLRPHPAAEQPRPVRPAAVADTGLRQVAILGRLGPLKGSGVLLRAAGDALERKLPLRFRLHGSSSRAELRDFPTVQFAGEYLEDEIEARLSEEAPDLLFLPSVCPETFSYTLDVALRTGLHPVCFDIGAPARRLRALGVGTVLPLELALDAPALNDALLAIGPQPAIALLEAARVWRSAEAFYGPD
jgi:glycosyltransferase involved in cell wall biosynthesis